MAPDNRKQSFYIPADMQEELRAEAERLDRSFSWLIQRAWKLARGEIKRLPSQEIVG